MSTDHWRCLRCLRRYDDHEDDCAEAARRTVEAMAHQSALLEQHTQETTDHAIGLNAQWITVD